MSVVITGIDKMALLRALWQESNPESFIVANGIYIPVWNDEKARLALGKYIEYFEGGLIQMNLHGSTVDPTLYNDHHGMGAFSLAMNRLRPTNE